MSSMAVVYIMTAVISVAIAIFLVYLADMSARAKVDAKRKKIEDFLESKIESGLSLKKTIYDNIDKYVASEEHGARIAEAVADIFDKELNKRVDSHSKKLAEKYENVIKEKSQNEEIAWEKYQTTLVEKEETDAVIRSIAEGLVVVDARGKVIMMNPAAEKLLGVSRKDKIGHPVMEGAKDEQLFSMVKDSPKEQAREIEIAGTSNETKKIVRASSAVIENENGQTIGMVSVLNDITKQKELDKLKSSFVANVSHELRTPLVAIGKSISLILGNSAGQISESQSELLAIADRNLKRLSGLINDLLDLSKLEAGKMELKKAESSIDRIIQDSMDGLKSWSDTKFIKLEKKLGPDLPLIEADSDKLVQVLTNLIGNAIKFTPKNGTITVTAKFNGKDNLIEFSVKDTGIGIPEEALSKLFDKFYQAGERVATDINGTGIGLSICKEIVELHGGRIWAESGKAGKGAEFIFALPPKAA